MSTTYTDLTETQFPDKVDDLSRMSDLTVSDVALVNQYYTYYNAGNLAAAAQLLIDNPTLMNKIFNAAKFNILRDALIALQRYYKSDVQTYIDSTRDSLQDEIDTFVPMGTYSSSTSYVKNNIVTYSGNGYICKQSCKGKTPGTTAGADYWQLIASKGAKGDSGTGLTFRGTYSSATAYTKDDAVTDGHAIWAALKGSTGQTLVEGAYWTKAIDIDVSFTTHNTANDAHENRFSAVYSKIDGLITSKTATLYSNRWINKSQTVSVSGVTSDIDIVVSPDYSSYDNWSKFSIIASAQGNGTVTFTCKTVPTTDITANILLLK